MAALVSFVQIVHIILCFLIVLAVLVQQGKGAEISASFGGSSQTVFGSSGGANFFSIFTWVCAGLFTITSLFLALQSGSRLMSKSVMDTVPTTSAPAAPVAPTSGIKPKAGAQTGVVPPKPETQGHAPDQTTKNAISPGMANPPPARKK